MSDTDRVEEWSLRLTSIARDARGRLRALSRTRFDDLAVYLVVPVGVAVVVAFVWTGQSGEAVASLLGAVLTALFAALTFRLLRNQDEASWLTSRPFLWCSAEHSADGLRIVVGNRSDAPALDVQVLLEITYDELDPSTSLPVCGLVRGSASALPPTTGQLTMASAEPRDVDTPNAIRTVAVFVLLGTQLGHACGFYYRLAPSVQDQTDSYALEEMYISRPSRPAPRRRRTSVDVVDELITQLELLTLPDAARRELANVREYRSRKLHAYTAPLKVEVSTADP